MATRAFISYARLDADVVTPIVQIMRAVGADTFQDTDSIPAGKKWRPVIEESLDNADIVLVFWSKGSSQSVEVEKEWRRAIEAGKDILPVLLDYTFLEPILQYEEITRPCPALGTTAEGAV